MVSVILPVLNGASTIEKSIESVRNQIYTDFELLIVDNGSTDGTIDVCKRYIEMDSRIQLLHSKKRGVVAGRKTGLDAAKGEYVAFIDADDLYEPQMLNKMVQAAIVHQADIISCGYINVNPDGTQENCFPKVDGVLTADKFFNCIFEGGTLGFLWNKLYKKNVIDECEHPENMAVCEDTYMNCSLMRQERRVVVLKECLYRYYVNPSSVTHTIEKKIDFEGNWKYLTSYRRIRELFRDDPIKAQRVQSSEWWVIKLGVEELALAGEKGAYAKKRLLQEMRKTLGPVIFSKESMRFKIGYLKCCLLGN